MYEKEDLIIEAPISNSLLINISNVQDIMSNWYPELEKIKISSSIFYDSHLKNNKDSVACFFSGGVDSSYTLLRNQKKISHLILVQGFDIDLDDLTLWNKSLINIEKISKGMKKNIITVQTNLRDIADKKRASWGRKYKGDFWGKILFGSSLASTGLCLQKNFGLIIIASSGRTRKELIPWGSHPDLDGLWSTEKLEFRHDILETRLNKTKYLSKFPLFIDNLRVCYSNKGGNINCGLCEKCIRTIIALKLCDVKPSIDNFNLIPDVKQIKLCRFNPKSVVPFLWKQMLEEAVSQGNGELAEAIAIALGKKFSFYRCGMLALQNVEYMFYKVIRALLPSPLRKKLKSIYNQLKAKAS
jgi:hypothetical protein